jgi:hypothetical protein
MEKARSSFSHQWILAALPEWIPWRRGPKTVCRDAGPLGEIREVLAASPFYSEGCSKVQVRMGSRQASVPKMRVKFPRNSGTVTISVRSFGA